MVEVVVEVLSDRGRAGGDELGHLGADPLFAQVLNDGARRLSRDAYVDVEPVLRVLPSGTFTKLMAGSTPSGSTSDAPSAKSYPGSST